MKERLRNHRIIKCELIFASMGLDCDDGWVEKSGLNVERNLRSTVHVRRQEIKRNVAFPWFMEKLKCFVCKYRFLFSFLSPSQPKPVIKYFRVDGNFILEENSRKLKISSLLFRLNSWALFLKNFAFAHTSQKWSEIKSFWSFSADFYDFGHIRKYCR